MSKIENTGKSIDAGARQYSVEVENSDDFWLDSFPTEEEAKDYIERNHLTVAETAGKTKK